MNTARFAICVQNAPHFVSAAYPPNKILKTPAQTQAFYGRFIKFYLALSGNKKSAAG